MLFFALAVVVVLAAVLAAAFGAAGALSCCAAAALLGGRPRPPPSVRGGGAAGKSAGLAGASEGGEASGGGRRGARAAGASSLFAEKPAAGASSLSVEELAAAPRPAALPPELGSLPAELRGMVVLNHRPAGLPPSSEFLDAVGRPAALSAIDAAISAGCVKEPSLYALSREDTVDGFAVRIFPKGWHLYKTFLGFVGGEQARAFALKHPRRPSWFGDKFLTYAIARSDWGSISSFRLEEDLVLLDYFNVANLERLVAEIEGGGGVAPAAVVERLRRATGLGLSPAEQVRGLAATYPTWPALWYYTEPALPQNTASHCECREVAGLNPMGTMKGVYALDLAVFDAVLARYPAIDGLVRDGVRSRVDEAGVFYHEEYLVKGSAQASKLSFDAVDPVCWTSWAFAGFAPPPGGLRLDYIVMRFGVRRPPNARFALARFFLENATPVRALPVPPSQPPLLLAFNVHGFVSLDAERPRRETRAEVLGLLRRFAPAVTFVVLTEAPRGGSRSELRALLADAGFPHSAEAPNGARDHSSLIVLAAKRPLVGVEVVSADRPAFRHGRGVAAGTHRKQLLFAAAEGLRGAAVHLEIGRRLVVGAPETNETIRAENSALRAAQLETVLARRPDFLVGDFNFTLDDPECRLLAERGFVPANDARENSTPYNRVDHCFVRRELAASLPPGGGNRLLHCNLSDHLPMLQALPWGPSEAAPAG